MGFFTVIGMIVCAAVGLAVLTLLALILRDVLFAWWQIVRVRAVMRRFGKVHPASVADWWGSIWRIVGGGYRVEYDGVIVPRSPFDRLGHNHRR